MNTENFPRYRCHKEVRAVKIDSLTYSAVHGTWKITPALLPEGWTHPFEVSQQFIDKHNPQPGGYFVVYEDGYQSYSPAAAFESGYTEIR